MNDTQLSKYRAQLVLLQQDIERQDVRGQRSQNTVTLDQQSVGRLSRMDALQHQAMAKATQARRDQMKFRITASLSRIKNGEFGYCVTCGDEIALKRLEFDPTIPTCLTCATGN
ncbi:MAG: TraR/DksA family transcriptional regulator [Paracoccaceae bacterium]